MTDALIAGVLAGLGIAMQVGAVTVYLLLLSSTAALRVGVAAALGVATIDGLYAAVAAVGGGAIGTVIAPIVGPLHWVAAGVLLWIAARLVITAIRAGGDGVDTVGQGVDAPSPLRAYLRMLGATVLNPSTIVYFLAIVISDRFGRFDTADRTVFALAALAASAAWQLGLAVTGSACGRLLTGRRGRLVSGVVGATLIAGLAIWGLRSS